MIYGIRIFEKYMQQVADFNNLLCLYNTPDMMPMPRVCVVLECPNGCRLKLHHSLLGVCIHYVRYCWRVPFRVCMLCAMRLPCKGGGGAIRECAVRNFV